MGREPIGGGKGNGRVGCGLPCNEFVMLAICSSGCNNSVDDGGFVDCKSLLGGTSCMFCDAVHNEGLDW